MRVLSVDDSKTVRQLIRNMVEVLPVEFLEAENGMEALRTLKSCNGDVDLIILDWDMPVMDGLEFLKIIKSNAAYRAIPVIMVTTEAQKDRVVDAVRSGVKQYITKPFSGEDLLTAVVAALDLDGPDAL